MKIEIAEQDGLLAFTPGAETHFLRQNPIEYHSQFHQICRQIYKTIKPSGEKSGEQSTLLAERGFVVEPQLFSADNAQALTEAYSREIIDQNKTANTKIEPSDALKNQILDLVAAALTRNISSQLESYYGCFFRIDHLELMRSKPAPGQSISYLWHRDYDPMGKIHILIYLTDCGPRSPATLFTNLDDTRRCAELGYSFPPRTERIADLSTLIPDNGERISITRPELSAGDATVFGPSRILHRGDILDQEQRDLLVLNILPSLNPWDREIAALGKERLFVGRNNLWFDPFSREKPGVSGHDNMAMPQWARQAYPFPLAKPDS